MQVDQLQRHMAALQPGGYLTRQPPPAQHLGHIRHADEKLLGYLADAAAIVG